MNSLSLSLSLCSLFSVAGIQGFSGGMYMILITDMLLWFVQGKISWNPI